MAEEPWIAVDAWFTETIVRPDKALNAAMSESQAADFPPIAVSPPLGKFLQLLARMKQARKILEIGTLGGYSTIWLARALPQEGRLVTLEIDPRNAEVALANIARAGLSDIVELRLGPALETLPRLAAEGAGPFDLIFIDADKQNNPDYFRWALKLAQRGSLIVVDNITRNGRVLDAESKDEDVLGVRRMLETVADEPRVSATTLQTVGSKGYDGFLMALVTADR